jgi:hypothetical protein
MLKKMIESAEDKCREGMKVKFRDEEAVPESGIAVHHGRGQ